MNKRSSWALPYFIFLVLFVVLPLLLIVLYALQDGAGHFTLRNITKFFTDKDALSTFALSIEVAIENTLLCVLIGYPAAYILADNKLNRSAVTVVLFTQNFNISGLYCSLYLGLSLKKKSLNLAYFMVNSNNSAAISGLSIRIKLSSSRPLERRFKLPYQTSDWSITA